jgi:hypothetical protein
MNFLCTAEFKVIKEYGEKNGISAKKIENGTKFDFNGRMFVFDHVITEADYHVWILEGEIEYEDMSYGKDRIWYDKEYILYNRRTNQKTTFGSLQDLIIRFHRTHNPKYILERKDMGEVNDMIVYCVKTLIPPAHILRLILKRSVK